MDATARDTYLETQILTATPQKLRLMLIEGALRYGSQALQDWQTDRNEAAFEAIIRCRAIVSELLTSVPRDESPLTRSVAGIYLFLFRSLTEAQMQRDRQKLQDVLDVLEVERGTWRLVCQQTSTAGEQPLREHHPPQEITAPHLAAIPLAPATPSRDRAGSHTNQPPADQGGFSFEA